MRHDAYTLANRLANVGNLSEALPLYLSVRPSHPDFLAARFYAAVIYSRLEIFEKAVALLDEIESHTSVSIETLRLRVSIYLSPAVSEFIEAERCCLTALRTNLSNTERSEVHGLLGAVRAEMGNTAQALEHYSIALSGQIADPYRCRTNLGIAQLSYGLTYAAFLNYEARWQLPEFRNTLGDFAHTEPLPLMLSDSTSAEEFRWHAAVIILLEQGFGDQIQFSRYLRFAPKGSVVITDRQLVRLIARWYPDVSVVSRDYLKTHPDSKLRVIPSVNLPAVTGLDYCSAPCRAGLSRSESEPVRIGVCFRSSKTDVRRDLDDTLLFSELRHLNARVFNLDIDSKVRDSEVLYPLRPDFDWLDTAEVLEGLDFVISVDTAVAHLAGSMGIPGLVIVTGSTDFRHSPVDDQTNQSPWYGSLQVLNKRELGARVVDEVLRRTKNFIESGF